MLLDKGTDVNAKKYGGGTALMIASEKGHTDVVEVLVEKGADANAKKHGGNTAVIIATEKSSFRKAPKAPKSPNFKLVKPDTIKPY